MWLSEKTHTRPALELCMDFLWPDCESRQQPLTSSFRARSLDQNKLTYNGNDMSGILKLAEVLPNTQLTSLR